MNSLKTKLFVLMLESLSIFSAVSPSTVETLPALAAAKNIPNSVNKNKTAPIILFALMWPLALVMSHRSGG
jgi:hypothetical protein